MTSPQQPTNRSLLAAVPPSDTSLFSSFALSRGRELECVSLPPAQMRRGSRMPLNEATLEILHYILRVAPSLNENPFVYDVGTGRGFLPIAVRQALPTARVFASDIDPRRFGEGGNPALKDTVTWLERDLRQPFPTVDREVNILVLSMVLTAIDNQALDHVAKEAARTLADRGIIIIVTSHHDDLAISAGLKQELEGNETIDVPALDRPGASDRYIRGEIVIPKAFARQGLEVYSVLDIYATPAENSAAPMIKKNSGQYVEAAALRVLFLTWLDPTK